MSELSGMADAREGLAAVIERRKPIFTGRSRRCRLLPSTRPFGRLDGRRAFVSGGANGIGAAIVRSFAEAGAHVVIADLDIETATGLAGQIGATAVRLDVGDVGMVQTTMSQHGPFDIVVNNAGVDQHAYFTQTTPADGPAACRQPRIGLRLHPRRPAGDAGGGLRAHHQHLVRSGAAGLQGRRGLRGGQGRGHRLREVDRGENARKGITAKSSRPDRSRHRCWKGPSPKAAKAPAGDDRGDPVRRLGDPDEVAAASGSWPPIRRYHHRQNHGRIRRHGVGGDMAEAPGTCNSRSTVIARIAGLPKLEPGHHGGADARRLGRGVRTARGRRPSRLLPAATWRMDIAARAPTDKAILYFHGGGFRSARSPPIAS